MARLQCVNLRSVLIDGGYKVSLRPWAQSKEALLAMTALPFGIFVKRLCSSPDLVIVHKCCSPAVVLLRELVGHHQFKMMR